jgi:hypothetical protein
MKTKSLASFVILVCTFVSSSYGISDIERELKRLIDERDQAIAAASAPITARFKTAAEQLLQRAMQTGDLDSANKIRTALGDQASTQNALAAAGPLKDLRNHIAGTKWKAMPGAILPGGLGGTLSFTEKTVEPGNYHYDALHDTVTVTFNHGGKATLMLAKDGYTCNCRKVPSFTSGRPIEGGLSVAVPLLSS